MLILAIVVLVVITMLALPITNMGVVHSQNNNSVLEEAQKSLQANENKTEGISHKVGNEPDLVFNVQGLKNSPVTKELKIKGEGWDEICPSNQCQIEEDGYSYYVVTPNADDSAPRVYLSLNLKIHDDITNKDLTPLQKKFVEGYQLSFSCSVNSFKDIIERGNNTIYRCSGDSTSIGKSNQEENDATFYYKVQGTYDNQSDTLNATGQFDRKF